MKKHPCYRKLSKQGIFWFISRRGEERIINMRIEQREILKPILLHYETFIFSAKTHNK